MLPFVFNSRPDLWFSREYWKTTLFNFLKSNNILNNSYAWVLPQRSFLLQDIMRNIQSLSSKGHSLVGEVDMYFRAVQTSKLYTDPVHLNVPTFVYMIWYKSGIKLCLPLFCVMHSDTVSPVPTVLFHFIRMLGLASWPTNKAHSSVLKKLS